MTHGLIIGKFMPPHAGHLFLAASARAQVDALTVVLFSKSHEPIPGVQRYAWLQRLLPTATVTHVTEEHPVDFASDAVWRLWIDAIRRAVPQHVDTVFSSEPYGAELAARLGARHMSIDPRRQQVPVSGTAIRAAPLAHWAHIPACVRPYFVKRVAIIGAESTGKTILARTLAQRLGTTWVPEFARDYLAARQSVCKPEDMLPIARGQAANEAALAESANRVLICDTNLQVTAAWSQHYFGLCDPEIEQLATAQRYDLVLLCTVAGTAWVADGLRDCPHQRAWFEARFRRQACEHRWPMVALTGTWAEREAAAFAAIRGVL